MSSELRCLYIRMKKLKEYYSRMNSIDMEEDDEQYIIYEYYQWYGSPPERDLIALLKKAQ